MTVPMTIGRVGVAPPTVPENTGVEVIMIMVLLELSSTVDVEVMIMVLLELGSIVDDIAVNTNQHKKALDQASGSLTYKMKSLDQWKV